jgi:hypothetical protein
LVSLSDLKLLNFCLTSQSACVVAEEIRVPEGTAVGRIQPTNVGPMTDTSAMAGTARRVAASAARLNPNIFGFFEG